MIRHGSPRTTVTHIASWPMAQHMPITVVSQGVV